MKKLCLFVCVVMLLCACETPPAKRTAVKPRNTVNYAYNIKPDIWEINTDNYNAVTALKALKAYEQGDTLLLHNHLADDIAVYYNGGLFKGSSREFMYAVKARINTLKNLHFEVKDCQSVISTDKQTEKVLTRYTQKWINEHNRPDSADVIDEAFFKDGRIVEWREYVRESHANAL